MTKRELQLRIVVGEDLGQATPVRVIATKIEVDDPGQKVIIFAIRGEDRDALKGIDGLTNLAKVLGDLVHPAQCVMAVIPEKCRLEVYEIDPNEKETDGANN